MGLLKRTWVFVVVVATLVGTGIFGVVPSVAAASDGPLAGGKLAHVVGVTSDAGSETSCAVISTGAVDCWGYGASGQLGNGTTTNSDIPVSTGITDGKAVADSYEGSSFCALLTTGGVDCWGQNSYGDLGDGSGTNSDVPESVVGLSNAVSVVGGEDNFCAVLSSGQIDCWGYDGDGELGNGSTGTSSSVPVAVETITNASAVVGGLFYFCSLLANGGVDCWGQNSYGQLGNGTTSASDVPVAVSGISTAKSVTAGSESASVCAVLTTGGVDCWGDNANGQLGNGTTTNAVAPVSTGLTDAKTLAEDVETEGSAVGFCALLTTGHIECWGDNVYGELGNKTTTASDVPVKVKKIKTADSIVGGDNAYCAVLASGSLDCWGRGDYGNLGDGTTTSSDKPVPVETITSGSKVVSGYLVFCSLLTTGKLDCWGYGGADQLGNAKMTNSDVPVAVKAT